MLDRGYRAVFDKLCFMQLMLVRQAAAGFSTKRQTVENMFSLLKQFDPKSIVGLATPFFWQSVNRLHAAGNSTPAAEYAIDGLAIAAADSFLPHTLATKFSPTVTPRHEGYSFPRLGRQLNMQAASCLEHAGNGRVTINPERATSSQQSGPISLTLPSFPSLYLLLSNEPQLFDEGYREKIFAETPNRIPLAEMISVALRMIGDLSPSLMSRINKMVQWYIPLRSKDFQIHNSFTASDLLGVIFLSDSSTGCA